MICACGSPVMCHQWHGDLSRLTMVSALLCNFLDSNGVVGFPLVFIIGAHVPYGFGLGQTLYKPRNKLG